MAQIIFYNDYWFGSRQTLSTELMQQFIDIFSQPRPPASATLGGRIPVVRQRISGYGPVVVKQYLRGGLARHFNTRRYLKLGKTRCQQEFDLLHKVRGLGINAPSPIAFAYRGTLAYAAWLVTSEIIDAEPLAQIKDKKGAGTAAKMRSVIAQTQHLIDHKILHPDLHPGNILINTDNQAFIIDFDKGGIYRGNRKRLRRRYLNRWARAVKKYDLPERLITELEAGLYHRNEPRQADKE